MKKIFRQYWLVVLLLLLAFVAAVSSVRTRSVSEDENHVAAVIGRNLASRIVKLTSFAKDALADTTHCLEPDVLPEDMVIYKYVADTLESWQNVVSVVNDDLRSSIRYQRVVRPEYGVTSPLSLLDEQWRFVNLGPHWYVARMFMADNGDKVMAALRICTTGSSGRTEDVNPRLSLSPQFYISPITGNLGSVVSYQDQDLFVINLNASDDIVVLSGNLYRWLAMVLLVIALFVIFFKRRDFPAFIFLTLMLSLCFCVCYRWGTQMASSSDMFSPAIYAGNSFLTSFGALLLLNAFIILEVFALYATRRSLLAQVCRRPGSESKWVYLAFLCAAFTGIVASSVITLRSLILNSSILLEIQWLDRNVWYSLLALLSYVLTFGSALLVLQMAAPLIELLSSHKIDFLTRGAVTLSSCVIALILFVVSGSVGFRKEKSSIQVWANKLSIDRNLSLEYTLRSMEPELVQDEMIALASGMDGASAIIGNRLNDNYLYEYYDEYSMKVTLCAENDMDCLLMFSRKLQGGTPLAPDSRFMCLFTPSGKCSYAGLFSYVSPINGNVVRVLIELFSRANREDNDYYSVFATPTQTFSSRIPPQYSYAKYVDDRLVSYKGTYPYSTVTQDNFLRHVEEGREYFRTKSFVHFIGRISPSEVIFISRPRKGVLQVMSSLLTLVAFVFITLFPLTIRRRPKATGRNYFKKRIVNLLIVALFLALTILAVISIKFVFDRNATDSYNMMSSRVSTIQTMVESVCQDARDETELMNQEFRNSVVEIASLTRSDINLFTLEGQVFISTVPDVFSRQLLSTRMDDKAYCEVVHHHQRIFIQKEKFEGKAYYGMYAPVFNRNDEMVAILGTPFTQTTNLMEEAIPHAVLVIIIVFSLMAFFTTVTKRVVRGIFAPLSEVSEKMTHVAKSGLENIDYRRNDELTPLIESYNRMVHDLDESTKILARTERDNAWSEMARQVAHEIKNPLTPMKLAIQRLVRLKQKNDPSWTEKFDDLAQVILDQIEILAVTASDFSIFAKLYSEDPVEIDLDALLQEQTLLFDNREFVNIEYIGTRDSRIMGPKPQLTRVIVNLLTNAVQAIENHQEDCRERGEEITAGVVNVMLRESARSGWFDIAVEDNGPGVPAENIDKLFTPKFTTKSGGTGLGLAMSRSIIEKCGGEILYRKSYTLGGACFLIHLPSIKA